MFRCYLHLWFFTKPFCSFYLTSLSWTWRSSSCQIRNCGIRMLVFAIPTQNQWIIFYWSVLFSTEIPKEWQIVDCVGWLSVTGDPVIAKRASGRVGTAPLGRLLREVESASRISSQNYTCGFYDSLYKWLLSQLLRLSVSEGSWLTHSEQTCSRNLFTSGSGNLTKSRPTQLSQAVWWQ